ncbi:amidase signature domain-containing protein [Macrophomina phaseolina]|uniref:amidase n=1 Tax=Macrophomina phaseolina TaxID=35725 RepID=A0ABQ8FU89_9PEZI|nr:amidase signature domain-containing protein [Macrophomina phaseolina]
MNTIDRTAEQLPWKARAAAKRDECLSATPDEWRLSEAFLASVSATSTSGTNLVEAGVIAKSGVLSTKEVQLTGSNTAAQLVEALQSGELLAETVVRAFCKRAAVAGQLTHCLTETFFDKALERARALDRHMAREKKPVGPLHGLPISLKDTFQLRGVGATIGFVSFLDQPPASHNSALVEVLLSLGAVPYCKTNVPQTLMTADTHNNIFGRTLNPHNTSLTAGGSSGGEAALLALQGSPLGIGTDVAGSIRIPALCCGVYGFKPTAGRVPFSGQASPSPPGLPGLTPAAGPMANSLGDVELFMRAVLAARPWEFDAHSYSVPWLFERYGGGRGRGLTVGVLSEDPAIPWHPPVKRRVEAAAAALAQAGHRMVRLPHAPETSASLAARIGFGLLGLDPRDTAMGHIRRSGEPAVPSVLVVNPPGGGRRRYGVEDVAELRTQQWAFWDAWRRLWLEHRLDVVLAPAAQHAAVPHDTFGPPAYTLMFNLLDYPACVIPYGTADKSHRPSGILVRDALLTCSHILPADPDAANGAPFAVQIVAPRFQDEACISAAAVVDKVLRSDN